MKTTTLKYYVLLLILAIIPSAALIRSQTITNVPFCIHAPGCTFNNDPKGRLTERKAGYPLSYHTTSTFYPNNNNEKSPNYAGYASASTELQGFSFWNILVNIIFWFALLKLLLDRLPVRSWLSRRRKSAHDMPAETK